MTAYVLIQTTDRSELLAGRLLEIPGIIAADDISGPFDAVALARTDPTHLNGETLPEIRGIPGVTHALLAPLLGPTEDPAAGERDGRPGTRAA